MKKSKKKVRRKPSQKSIRVDKNTWYYESYSRIDLVHEAIVPLGRTRQTDIIPIPMKKLVETLKNCGYIMYKRKRK